MLKEWLITWYDTRTYTAKSRVINTVKATADRAYIEIHNDDYNNEVRMWELIRFDPKDA